MKYIFSLVILLSVQFSYSQSFVGKWQTIDDETGQVKSVVEIFEKTGMLYGRITKLFRAPNEDQNPMCTECEDDRKDQQIIGMVILRDMMLKDGYYQSGTICDPKNGKVYKCEMWLDEKDKNKLQLRGYWGFFYRTQTWVRTE
jgi:uncharacterized protein (DUF2147 family)